jgi:hypothetical protein
MDRCGQAPPPGYEIAAAHHAACYLYEPEGATAPAEPTTIAQGG